MKILWIVNTIFPYPAKEMNLNKIVFGGWLNSLFEELNKNKSIQITVVSTYKGKKLLKFDDKKSIYYLIPCKNNTKKQNLHKYWEQVFSDFEPDIIHIHGTEYSIGLNCMNLYPNYKYIVSIQGMLSLISDTYYSGISTRDIIRNITIRDLIKYDSIINTKNKLSNRAEYEKEMIKKCDYVIGRTTSDYSYTSSLSNIDKYFKCNESLRSCFYNKSWQINNINRNTIFVSQASYPTKGFHILLKSIEILKKDFPDIKIIVAGPNILEKSNIIKRFKRTGYAKYIRNLIKKYNLNNNIVFKGLLTEDEMVKELLKANVFVQASSMENSPNSLGEAMILGMPCIATYVGGTMDMLKDKEEGYLYPFPDYTLLAFYIKQIFNNDEYAIKFGTNARKHALVTHDKKINTNKMLEIYKNIINGGTK